LTHERLRDGFEVVKLPLARRPRMRRDELTDAQWNLIEPLLPMQSRGGRWNEHRATLNGML